MEVSDQAPAPARRSRPFHTFLAGVFGSTLAIQFLGVIRHSLVAAYFGISRDYDLYAIVNSIATVSIFTFAGIFDNVAVPRLSSLFSAGEHEEFRRFSERVLSLSVLATVGLSLAFWLALPVITLVVAAGVTPAEQQRMHMLSLSFLPWTLISLPYYSMCSFFKARWLFQRVLFAEIVIMLVSVACLALWHDHISALPLAYGAGYAVAATYLFAQARLRWRWPSLQATGMRPFLRNTLELFATNQLGGVTSMLERFLQSFLQPGSIAAYSYASLVVNNTGALLNFREIFIVPLSEEHDRPARLERLIIGMTLLTVPMIGFIYSQAAFIVQVLYQRGHFDAAAAGITVQVLKISCWTLWPSLVAAPIFRLFQILDRISVTGWFYAANLVTTACLGWLLIFKLGLGLPGFALTGVASSYLGLLIATLMLRALGVSQDWFRIAKYVVSCLGMMLAGMALSGAMPSLANVWLDGLARGCLYWVPTAAAFVLLRPQLRSILGGAV